METILASRNSTERKGEPEIDFVGPVYSNRTGIIARGRDTVLPVNGTSPEMRSADAGKPGMLEVRKLVETSLGAGASLLLGLLFVLLWPPLLWPPLLLPLDCMHVPSLLLPMLLSPLPYPAGA